MSSNQFLTQRDIEIITTIYKHRYLKTPQIKQLYFPSEQTANRRLKSLTNHGLLKYFIVPNIPERIYYITKKGAHLVAEQLNLTINELAWTQITKQPKDYYFMRHFLGINQFRIDLTKACEPSEIQLVGFIPEYHWNKHATGRITKHIHDYVFDIENPREKISHTPDAVFALSRNDKTALFFLEIDRGTEVIGSPGKGLLKMLRYYINYGKSGKFRSYQQEFNCSQLSSFRLLIVTTTHARMANMCRSASQHYPTFKGLTFFWISTFEQVSMDSLFKPTWRSLAVTDKTEYAIG